MQRCRRFLAAPPSEARHLLSGCLSVCLIMCTCDARLNDSEIEIHITPYDRGMFPVSLCLEGLGPPFWRSPFRGIFYYTLWLIHSFLTLTLPDLRNGGPLPARGRTVGPLYGNYKSDSRTARYNDFKVQSRISSSRCLEVHLFILV